MGFEYDRDLHSDLSSAMCNCTPLLEVCRKAIVLQSLLCSLMSGPIQGANRSDFGRKLVANSWGTRPKKLIVLKYRFE